MGPRSPSSVGRVPICRVTGPPFFPVGGVHVPREGYLFSEERVPLNRGTGTPCPIDVHRCGRGCVPFSKGRVPLLPIEGYPLSQGRTTLSGRTGTPISEGLKSPFPRDGCLFSQDQVPLPEDGYPIAREGFPLPEGRLG